MGKESDAMREYLKDNDRFADLFNGGVFGGQPVVKPCDLMEGLESYKETYFKNGHYNMAVVQRKGWQRDEGKG